MSEDVANTPDQRVSFNDMDSLAIDGKHKGKRNPRRAFNKPGQTATMPKAPKFEGRCEELKGHVYDCSNPRQAADEFTRTTKEIAEYTGIKYGAEVKTTIETLQKAILPLPSDPPPEATVTQKRIWEKRVDAFVKAEITLESDLKKAHSLVYGQCSDAMRAKLDAIPNHSIIMAASDVIGLLQNIKSVTFNFQSQKYEPHALHEAKRRFYMTTQHKGATCQSYLETFHNSVEVLEYCGGDIGTDLGLVERALASQKLTFATATKAQIEESKEYSKQAYLACAFLLGSDRNRYGKLIEDLENDFIQGQDRYPKTTSAAYNLLVHWKQNPQNLMRVLGTTGGGVAFTNVGEEEETALTTVGGKKDKSGITCFNCNQKGHYSNECPRPDRREGSKEQTGTQMLIDGVEEFEPPNFQFHQGREGDKLPQEWILLDNQSTVDVFSNPRLLKNIHTTAHGMTIKCNAGTIHTNMIGEMPGYPGQVWYNPKGIANILSLANVTKHYKVTYDSERNDCFIVHKADGTTRKFKKSTKGLFYLDTTEKAPNETVLVNTVQENKSSYTVRDYKRAELARQLQDMIGRPSNKDFIKIVQSNLLPNCPITTQDIVAAEDIFGPNLGSLKGKTVRRKGEHVTNEQTIILPIQIMLQYQNVTLCIDVMFINKIPFLMTVSRNIKFGTAEMIHRRDTKHLIKAINHVKALYKRRGFRITTIHADNEFEPLRLDLLADQNQPIQLNTAANAEHVPEIERYIRTVKERVRCVWNTMPFTKVPSCMVVELVHSCIFWLNTFPPTDGVSDTISPRSIIVGSKIDYNKHCRIAFGEYVQTHEEHDNSMATRTTGAIALRPTGNEQGGYYFMSLATGRRLNRNHWTPLPMPQEVIERVHTLARRSYANRGLTFAWRNGDEIQDTLEDVEDDTDDEYNDNDDHDHSDDESLDTDGEDDSVDLEDELDPDPLDLPIAGVAPQEIPEQLEENNIDQEIEEGEDRDNNQPTDAAEISDEEYHDSDTVTDNYNHNDTDTDDDDQTNNEPDQPGKIAGVDEQLQQEMDNKYGARNHAIGLRPRRRPKYSQNDETTKNKPSDYNRNLASLQHTTLTQYSIKKGLKVFGKSGADAVVKEMTQLDERGVIEPRRANMLTKKEKKDALEYLMFLKKKRCGKIKGRGCADGRKQRLYKTKEETSAPTVAIESLFLSSVIDAQEGRDVATCDIPGAFMQADMDEKVHMRLSGPLAKLLTTVNKEKYERYMGEENGKPVIYVRLRKALYGTLQAALLFWKDLSSQLEKWDFTLNPYDNCVANKTINGSQCTVLWHVDDLKISHIDPKVVDQVIEMLEERYGKEAPLTVTRGRVHDYLGMTLDFSTEGKVVINMEDYVEGVLEDAPDDMAGVAMTPAPNHLFEINKKPILLDEEQSEFFHSMTAKLLFLAKRGRPDIQTAVAFLTTRVKGPDEDDYKKLARVIKYLRHTQKLGLTLEADNTRVIKWWIDASFAVHKDMRSHTGGTMSMGKGSLYSTSTRQRINTKSSTEAELVGVDDLMPMIVWTRYFLQAQGYEVRDSKVYQDNQSAMLLEKNGKASSSKRTRHINIRFFFVTDRARLGEVSIDYCPTGDMTADFFTKPLQGSQFRKFRSQIMNTNE